MDKDKLLRELFENDPLGLLNIKSATNPARNEDERLVASFREIVDFYEKHKRLPAQGGGIQEHQLYARLESMRKNPEKVAMLEKYDTRNFFQAEQKVLNSLEDIFGDDTLGLLDDDAEGLFELRHVSGPDERASADFVARRKACRDFELFEGLFKEVQNDLGAGKRRLTVFKEENLRAGDFYVHNGVLLYLENVEFEEQVQEYRSGSRVRKDGRTRVIFENGTESNMLYRSLYKALLANGSAVTVNSDQVNQDFIETFNSITEEDRKSGFIYILKSKSENPAIRSIQNLYKIGFSKTTVEDRIKNARQDPTFLMADVRIVMTYQCYNMNPQKLEQLLHTFFGSSCLNIDVFDQAGQRHTPREWFIAPLDIIEQAVRLIISGEIVQYRYDAEQGGIVGRV
jgi:hypothetical protein